MFCGNCGKQINEGQRFCPNCGKQLAAEPVQPVAPAPVKVTTPISVQPVAPAPVQPVAPAPVQPVAPAPEKPVAPAPVQPVVQPPIAQPVTTPVKVVAPTPEKPAAPAVNNFQPAVQTPIAQPVPAFSVSSPMGEMPVKKKGNGGKIALIIIAVLLVAGIVLTIVNWQNIVRTIKRATMEPTDYIVEVEKKGVADLAKSIGAAYDSAMQTMDMTDASTKTETTLQLGDTVITLLEQALAQEGMDVDLSWIEDISLDVDANRKDSKISSDISLGLNGTHLATISVIMDTESSTMWVGIPELSSTYMEIDTEEVLGTNLSDMYSAMGSTEMYATLAEILPSGSELESMINRYMGVVLDQMQDVEKKEETVKLDGLKQKMLVMTAEFSQKDIINIAIALVKEARSDRQLKNIVVRYAELMGEDSAMLEESYTSLFDDALEGLEDTREEVSKDTFLTLETYLDNKDKVVGRTVTVENYDEEVEISYITVTQKGKFAFEADFAGQATVTGEGTIKDGKTNGEYVLEVYGEDYLTLTVENYYTTDSGAFSGTFVLAPESAMLEAMDLDSSMLQTIGSNVAIKVSMDTTTGTPALSFGILTGSTKLFNIDISSKTGKAGSVSVPSNSVEVSDEYDAYTWLEDVKLDTVIDNLEKSGIPSEYMDIISMVAGMIAS